MNSLPRNGVDGGFWGVLGDFVNWSGRTIPALLPSVINRDGHGEQERYDDSWNTHLDDGTFAKILDRQRIKRQRHE